jgi:hypothetical protein
MLELVLRAYFVLSALPVLGLLIAVLVDVSSTSYKKRRLEADQRAGSSEIPTMPS